MKHASIVRMYTNIVISNVSKCKSNVTNQQVPNQQGTTRPYRILVSQQQYQTCTSNQQCGLQPLQVSIQGQGGLFRGFIVQARTPNGGSRSWGQFIPLQTGDSKVIQCQNGLTLTHTANNDKNIVRFAWIPEPGMREQVQFVATVVQNLRTIYPGVYSAQLRPVGVSAIRVFNNAPFKTAGIISFVTSVIAILL